jgi:hypothetical protein
MDKIVDHLFILEVMVEDFQETTLILELMKTVLMLLKREAKRKTGNKTIQLEI